MLNDLCFANSILCWKYLGGFIYLFLFIRLEAKAPEQVWSMFSVKRQSVNILDFADHCPCHIHQFHGGGAKADLDYM